MRIGVVSDTHMSAAGARLPKALAEGLSGVDLILHAGDWTSPVVADLLERIAPVEGVAGNNDGEDIVRRFGRRKIIRADGLLIGIVHGDGWGKTTEKRAFDAFAGEPVGAVVFGHSHTPHLEWINGVLLFNPGSPWDRRRQPRYSFGILDVIGDRVKATHVYFDKRE